MGEGTKKLSKRDPQSNLFLHRDRGFIPEGLLNYLALLGWSIAADRDVFTLDEMVAAFDVADVNAEPGALRPEEGRRDQRRAHPTARPGRLHRAAARLLRRARPRPGLDDAQFAEAAQLVQTRIVVLGDAWGLLKFLDDGAFAIDEKAAAKELRRRGAVPVLDAALAALDGVTDWTADERSRRR